MTLSLDERTGTPVNTYPEQFRPPRELSMGVLFLASGVLFVRAVADPPIIGTWGDSPAEAVTDVAGHKTAWYVNTWLIALSVVAGIAAVTLLARSLRTDTARVGAAFYLVGSGLILMSVTFDLTVTSGLIGGSAVPDWYLGIEQWSDGLGTAFFALLAPTAMVCLGAEIVRTRVLPRWTGVVFLVAAAVLLGQYLAFLGALPFPQFLAFAAIGIAAIRRGRQARADEPSTRA